MLDAEVVRPHNPELTSLGAAYLAGLAVGYWSSPAECFAGQKVERIFKPEMPSAERDRLYTGWTKAVKRCMGWAQ